MWSAGRAGRIACVALVCLAVPVLAPAARAATFAVDTTIDAVDLLPGDGICATGAGTCSLRAAVQESNALAGADTIDLPAGVYVLTIGGAPNSSAASGDLDIAEALTILGAGARTTIIDGNRLDRVFDALNKDPVSISGVTIRNGSASGTADGGGIATHKSVLTLTEVALVGNSSGGGGGGLYLDGGSTVLADVAVTGNSALSGGGIFVRGGTLSLTNVTISGSTAGAQGGGLFNQAAAVILTNVTLASNSAVTGGGLFQSAGTTTLKNTIVAGNSGGNCNAPVTSSSHDLDSGNGCGLTGPGDLVNSNPLLGPLQNNGGSTDTHALLAGSPAIDTGTNAGCPATDQRGIARPLDGNSDGTAVCDVGAFEYDGPPPAMADLSLTKTVDKPTPSIGDTVLFTLAVHNAGPANASGISVTDLLPSGFAYVADSGGGTYASGTGVWTVGNLSAGGSTSHTISATVNASGRYINTAEITAAGQIDPDSTPGDGIGNGEDDEATVAVAPAGSADLSLTKTVNNSTPTAGGQVVFTLTVANAGPSPATGVAVTDRLPAGYAYVADDSASTGTTYASGTGIWTVGSLAVGGRIALAITATVNPAGPYVNSAEITAAGQPDPDSTPNNGVGSGEDDEAAAGTAPLGSADLSLTKTVDNPAPAFGGTVVFTVTVANAGPSPATGVAVTDRLPAGYAYVGDNSAATATTYVPATGLWTVGSLAAGASIALAITTTVNPAGPYLNAAEITAANEADPDSTPNNGVGNGEDDQASRGTTPSALRYVALTKAATRREVAVGGLADYVLTAENISGGTLAGIVVSDQIPAGFKFAAGTARLVRAGPDGRVGTADDTVATLAASGERPVLLGPFDLAAGETVQIGYVLRVGSGVLPGEHSNQATPFQGTVPVGNSARASVEVLPDPTFDLSTIIGKVFRDSNRNGWQDSDEPGVPGAMVALDDGTYAVTDEEGRYHFPAVNPGQRMVKINRNSLPPGAVIVTDVSRVLWVSPGLLARADFGVLLKTETETIGRPAPPGVRLTAAVEDKPIEVLGSVEALSALVNGQRVRVPSSDVQISVEGPEDIVPIGAAGLDSPIAFDVETDRQPVVRGWTLTILDETGGPFRTFRGAGRPPETIRWDGRSEAGDPVAGGGLYQYQLDLVYEDGARAASARRVFGVEQSRWITLRLTGDAFLSGKADLTDKAKSALEQTFGALHDLRDERVVIEGYTDALGSRAFNRDLSRRRARAAAAYLETAFGVSSDRIVTAWYGADRPVASNDTPEGRAQNRRVEIRVEARKVTHPKPHDLYQTAPAADVNGTPVEIARDGRFATRIPATGADRVSVEMSDREGRFVETSVRLPGLTITSPLGRHLLHYGEADDACRVAPRPDDAAARPRGGPKAAPAATCRLQASTQAGNTVEFDGSPLKVAPDGTFAADLRLEPGENVFGLLVRNPAGFTRIASLEVAVADKDEAGLILIAREAIPHLTIELPETGAVLSSRTLGLTGATDPGNRVTINGRTLEVRSDGRFSGSIDLPEGASRLVVEVADRKGGVGRIEREVRVDPQPLFMLALADGMIGRLSGHGFTEAAGLKDGNDLFTEGRVAFYLKGTVRGKYLVTAAFDSDRGEFGSVFGDLDVDQTRRLLTNLDPDKLYPVYGDGSTVVHDAQSQGKLYLAVEGDTLQALYGNYPLALTDTEIASYQRTLHGGRLVYQSLSRTKYGAPDTRVVLFGADVRHTHVRDELRASGGSLYYLSQPNVVEGSEEVTLVVRDKNTGLTLSRERQRQNIDYTIKYEEGRLMFLRAVGSVAPSGTLVDQELLSGHPVFIQVDYDSIADAFEKTSYGGRVRRQMGDHLALGATYVEDKLGAAPYELKGGDAEIRLGRGSRITAEYAESDGVDSATFVSEDGGVSFNPVATTGSERGYAFKAAADLDVGEWLGHPDRFRLRAYVKNLDPGFFSNGNTAEQGTDKEGVNAAWKMSDADSLVLQRDREDRTGIVPPGGVAGTVLSSAQWSHRTERWGLDTQLLEKETRDDSGDLLHRSDLAAARIWSKLTQRLLAGLERQETLGGPPNDQTTLDLQYRVARSLALTARGTDGSLGRSAEAGAVLTAGEGTVYVTERAVDDRAGERTATVVGARAPIGPDVRVYSEYQWEEDAAGPRRVSLVGVQRQWEAGPGLRFLLSGETADVTGGSLVSRRSAATGSLTYSASGLTAVTRQQVRLESGAVPAEQLLSFNQIDYHLGPAVTLQGKFRYSRTSNRETGDVEARLEERGLGFAFRPVTHDRLNILARYSRVLDLRPLTVPLQTSERVLDVMSLETAYDLSRRVESLSKLAVRRQEERLEGIPPVASRAYLAIERLNVRIWRTVSLGAEYRVLAQPETQDRRQGWLTEAMWDLHENFRIGGGFNFTDFSDDAFARNDYRVTGWFLRVQGRY